ncbi:sensor histidine kinase [Kitasatospora sp. NBC_00458]|uniref:sensor histidine kinase n=1 Tax=Kitasatospora sp. NBC_00458 TaxID=2903568 RepID=UPI002E1943CC
MSRPAPRQVVADLLTLRPQPMPPLAWPQRLRRLPHVAVALGAAALAATGADPVARLLAVVHAATVVIALLRPVAAWWLATVLTVVISVAHPPTHDNELWTWPVQAGVLLLLALRNRPAVSAAAAAGSALCGTLLKLAGCPVGSWTTVAVGCGLFASAVMIGAVRRGRREDRARLIEQTAATAHERALRTVLEERARIARELHDVVAHHMSVVAIKADAAPYRVADPPPELTAELAAIRAVALDGLNELRRLLGVLRADGPDGRSAGGTAPQPSLERLDTLLDTVRSAGLTVGLVVDGPRRPLPPGVGLSAYRIVQEALSNTLRHAPGAHSVVELSYRPSALGLRVVNGPATRGAPPSPGGGHGLTGLRERAAMLGGDLAAGPTPDGGYEVAALLPVTVTTATTHEDGPA